MVEFRKGQKAKLADLTPGTDLYVGLRLDAPGLTFDISCFGLDANDRLSDDRYFVFFNQPKSPEESIQLLGAQAGDQESFRVTLDRVPPQIGKLAFTATLDGQGQMSQVASGYIRIAVGGQEVVRYAFTGTEFSTERAVMIADIYRKEPNVWRFAAVGQGFDGGLKALLENFGGEAMEDEDDGKGEPQGGFAPPPQASAPSFGPPPGAPAPQTPVPQPNPLIGPPPGAPQPVPAHSAPPMQPPGQFPGQGPPPGQFPPPGMPQPGMQPPGMPQPGFPPPGGQPGMMPQGQMAPPAPMPVPQQGGMPGQFPPPPGMPQPGFPPPGGQPGMPQPGMPAPGMGAPMGAPGMPQAPAGGDQTYAYGLQQFAEVQGQARWTQQNPKMVKVLVGNGPKVIARQGSMVAYQGKVDFKFQGQRMRDRFENRMTGQSLELMRVEGDGEVFLAEQSADLHIVELGGNRLCVNAANLLAWDEGLTLEPRRIEGQGIPGGGLFVQTISGNGAVIVKTKGHPLVLPVAPGAPTFADTNAIVAWTDGMQVSTSTAVRVRRTAYPGHSGETVSLQFRGMQGHFIVVQPYEV
ncbi:hypothetical protein GCM10023205_08150 [Yinghuangia aomiensis]|uniref:TerD domain-containing protein n=1 Tax=Yinghuangia aomiensis TaxID=676205 RepID=A0ABP9GPY9_9ACTN